MGFGPILERKNVEEKAVRQLRSLNTHRSQSFTGSHFTRVVTVPK